VNAHTWPSSEGTAIGWEGRISFTDKNQNGKIDVTNNASTYEIIQENGYYAFGMTHEGPWLMNDVAKDNMYIYNSKELNTDHGLNWSDYGARWYDACLGRWTSVDPLGSEYPSYSPYNYTLNNPIRLIDPDGRAPEDVIGGDPIKEFLKSTGAYIAGASNAMASNMLGGAPGTRNNPNSFGENS
jgi:RHS repeat-associated protein